MLLYNDTYLSFIIVSDESINLKSTKKHIKLTGIIFLNLLLNKKANNNPNKNKISGILFPETMMLVPIMQIAIVVNINLRLLLFLNTKVTKNIEKKEKFCM